MNNVRKNFDNLLEKSMDRRTFLKHVGLGAALVVGLGPVLKLLSAPPKSLGLDSSPQTSASRYGDMAYGGKVTQQKLAPTRRLVQ